MLLIAFIYTYIYLYLSVVWCFQVRNADVWIHLTHIKEMLQVIKFVIICVSLERFKLKVYNIYIVERERQSHNFLEHFLFMYLFKWQVKFHLKSLFVMFNSCLTTWFCFIDCSNSKHNFRFQLLNFLQWFYIFLFLKNLQNSLKRQQNLSWFCLFIIA